MGKFFPLIGIACLLASLLAGCAGHQGGGVPSVPDAKLLGHGNIGVESFSEAKRLLYEAVYRNGDERRTLYCGFRFDGRRTVSLPDAFSPGRFAARASRVEAEHVVPAENFGRSFREWREGDGVCIDSNGRYFKGRRCAEYASQEFRRMEADMHNLWPAVGAVNAARSNYSFVEREGNDGTQPFGPTCPMIFHERSVTPTEASKGPVARAYLYMDAVYPRYRMSDAQRRLMEAWDRSHPPAGWECERNRRIAVIQGNSNPFVERGCR